ncbi:MAG TPA: helix-turn-helix transcriptional regulator [Chitinophagaceae bacterium]
MHIGERIKKLRIAKHLKQRAVANMLGISLTAYGDIERGKTINLTLPRVEQIAGVLKVPATTIINGHSNTTVAVFAFSRSITQEKKPHTGMRLF